MYCAKFMDKYQINFNKIILYKSTHRGMRELDWILGTFVEKEFSQLSDDDQKRYAVLLTYDDPDLWRWFCNPKTCPSEWSDLIIKIRTNCSVVGFENVCTLPPS